MSSKVTGDDMAFNTSLTTVAAGGEPAGYVLPVTGCVCPLHDAEFGSSHSFPLLHQQYTNLIK